MRPVYLVYEYIAGVGVTVDVSVLEYHLAVQTPDLPTHVEHVDVFSPQTKQKN